MNLSQSTPGINSWLYPFATPIVGANFFLQTTDFTGKYAEYIAYIVKCDRLMPEFKLLRAGVLSVDEVYLQVN